MSGRARILGIAAGAVLGIALAPGCSQGDGTGSASGTLDVPDCWSGAFDLKPDFFAAVPSTSSFDALQIRVQNGGDYESFSDGIAILVDDAGEVRGDPTLDGTPRPSLIGQPLIVALPPGIAPPGVPIVPEMNPSIVHASLYLQRTCRTQNLALYALAAVTLNPDGTCQRPPGGEPPYPCGGPAVAVADAGGDASGDAQSTAAADASTDAASSVSGDAAVSSADASAGDAASSDAAGAASGEGGGAAQIGTSTIVFKSLFDGNPDEENAQNRLTDAQFDFYFADPRETCPGAFGPPPRCRGHLTGSFKFYFERGQPAQAFP
jgi:hypothetical protein